MTASVPDTGGHSSGAARREEATSKKDAVLSTRQSGRQGAGGRVSVGVIGVKGRPAAPGGSRVRAQTGQRKNNV